MDPAPPAGAVNTGASVPEYDAFLRFAVETARTAGKVIRDGVQRPIEVQSKGLRNLLTDIDLAAERTIVDAISRRYPDHDVLTEETLPGERASRYQWVIDPLDGTENFLHSIPHFAISVGLQRDGELVAGLVFNPINGDVYAAERGKGAFFNDRRLRVSARKRLGECVVAIGKPRRGLMQFHELEQSVGGLRRTGAGALDLCWVAAGRYDAFIEEGIKIQVDTRTGEYVTRVKE